MDNAMNYEYLIRRIYGCGRHGVEGADADIYRKLSRAYALYNSEKEAIENKQPRMWNQSLDELAFELGASVGQVAAYIKVALEKVLTDSTLSLRDEQRELLEECKSNLFNPTFEKINSSINKAEKTLVEVGLFPR